MLPIKTRVLVLLRPLFPLFFLLPAAFFLFATVTVGAAGPEDSAPKAPPTLEGGMALLQRHLLAPLGISDSDLDLTPIPEKRDVFRLEAVSALLRNPLSLPSWLDSLRKDLTAPKPSAPSGLLSPVPLFSRLRSSGEVTGAPGSPSFGFIPGSPRAQAAEGGPAGRSIEAGLQAYLAPLRGEDLAFLRDSVSGSFLQEEEDTTLNPWEIEKRRRAGRDEEARVYSLAASLRGEGLVRASGMARDLLQAALEIYDRKGLAALRAFLDSRRGPFPLHLGSEGADRHRVETGIYLDPGGDDEWIFEPVKKAGAFLLVLDLKGRDRYHGSDSLHRGAGNLGISLLADLAGDDAYLGRNFAWASSLFGYSHLFDRAGNDLYEGRCAGQAFAFFGAAILQDIAGNDLYSAALLSQAASSTQGFALLLDEAGNDEYLARSFFVDDLRYQDRHLHMMQGFSTGSNPGYGGGIALLWDRRGNDRYACDIFGQGTGYWYALGLLFDDAGNDNYQSFQYAQGAGVHLAVGVLTDLAGDDRHHSKGVSLGCGHDYALGVFFEGGGNDDHAATDMSLGGGSANGLGIFLEMEGRDTYAARNRKMTLGHADQRRDRGSFGFFLEAGGADLYSPPSLEDSAWTVYGREERGNGVGLDADGLSLGLRGGPISQGSDSARKEPPLRGSGTAGTSQALVSSSAASRLGAPLASAPLFPALTPRTSASLPAAAVPLPSALPFSFSRFDSLFLAAATGEPRFQPLRDSSEALLRAGRENTLDSLLRLPLATLTPRHLHYVQRFFALIADSGRDSLPRLRLGSSLASAPDSVKAFWLWVGSKLEDTAFARTALPYTRHDSVEVRKMAWRALGASRRPWTRPFLLAEIGRSRGLELQQRLWGLSRQERLPRAAGLAFLLADSNLYNRQAVRSILVKSGLSFGALLQGWDRGRFADSRGEAALFREHPALAREAVLLALELSARPQDRGARAFLARHEREAEALMPGFFQRAAAAAR